MGRRPKPKSEDVFAFTIGVAEIFAILCYETAGKVLHSSGALPDVCMSDGMLHAAVAQNVTFGRYGVPACPWAIFEPGNRSRRVKLV